MPLCAALLCTHDGDWSSPEEAATTRELAEFTAIAGDAIHAGAALRPTSTATTVRVSGGRGGDIAITDGPFAGAEEVLGGFFLLEAADLDAAVTLAEQIPAAWDGGVELRPALPKTCGAAMRRWPVDGVRTGRGPG